MINLKNTTFIIPLRIDHEDRLINANITLNYLTKHFDTNIILLEDGEKSHYNEFGIEDDKNVKYIFIENKEEIFHRTKYLNTMLKQVKTPVVVNYDIDVLLPVESYVKAENMIVKENYDVVYPFSNPPGVYYINQEHKHLIKSDYNINNYDSIKNEKEMLSYEDTSTTNDNGLNTEKKTYNEAGLGFCIFFNTHTYLLFGGENEDFYGWGPEDQERAYRFYCISVRLNTDIEKKNQFNIFDRKNNLMRGLFCKCLFNTECIHKNKYKINNYVIRLMKNDFGPVYHLEHWRGVNSDSSHSLFKKNQELFINILNSTRPKLLKYYETKSFFDRNKFYELCTTYKITVNKNESLISLFKKWRLLNKQHNIPFPLTSR